MDNLSWAGRIMKGLISLLGGSLSLCHSCWQKTINQETKGIRGGRNEWAQWQKLHLQTAEALKSQMTRFILMRNFWN